MAHINTDLDFGKGYKYRPTVGIFKDGELLIDEKKHCLQLPTGKTLLVDLENVIRIGEMNNVKRIPQKDNHKAEQFDGSDEMCERYGIKQHIEQLGPLTDLYFLIPTKEGNMKLNAGDWIATGIDREHWAISQEIFEKTYERVDQE